MIKQKKYCCYCSSPISRTPIEGKERDYCPQCNTIYYENPLPVASVVVVNTSREVLLVRRSKEPYHGMWCLPIGFAESGEEVQNAALRELREEAGVEGEIIRLLDVDTIDNYFYGSLAIVTYEARITGGMMRPGDDASDARFFPIEDLPPLAWSSNEKAVRKYLELYRDNWRMLDSFRHLFPEGTGIDSFPADTNGRSVFLSNVLIALINSQIDAITDGWAHAIALKIPGLRESSALLVEINNEILATVSGWLQRGYVTADSEKFVKHGRALGELGLPLPDILTALALSRKSIWTHLIQKRMLSTPLEIYTTLELNNRIIFFYDRIIYSLVSGYVG